MSVWKVEAHEAPSRSFVASLVVGSQRFTIGPAYKTRGEAEWMAAQLRHAIETIERGVLEDALGTVKLMGCAVDDDHEYQSVRDEVLHAMRKAIAARLPSCSGCEPGSEGTHSTGTKEHL